MAQPKTKIKPNEIRVRDHRLVRLINGATKAGVQRDRKKEQDRRVCRKPVKTED